MIWFMVMFFCLGLVLSEPSQECRKIFVKYKHPYTCCKYPQKKVPAIIDQNCKEKCENKSDTSECCLMDCMYRDTGIWLNDVFNGHALLKLYENYLDDTGAGKYDEWMVTVEKSIKKCSSLMPKSNKLFRCNFPEHINDVIDCVNLMNYLDCPDFPKTADCDSARTFVQNPGQCGREINGIYLLDQEYFDFKLIDRRGL